MYEEAMLLHLIVWMVLERPLPQEGENKYIYGFYTLSSSQVHLQF